LCRSRSIASGERPRTIGKRGFVVPNMPTAPRNAAPSRRGGNPRPLSTCRLFHGQRAVQSDGRQPSPPEFYSTELRSGHRTALGNEPTHSTSYAGGSIRARREEHRPRVRLGSGKAGKGGRSSASASPAAMGDFKQNLSEFVSRIRPRNVHTEIATQPCTHADSIEPRV